MRTMTSDSPSTIPTPDWFCPICGRPITASIQPKISGGVIVMLTCFNKPCKAYTCTTSDTSVLDGHFCKVWGFTAHYNPQTGQRLNEGTTHDQ